MKREGFDPIIIKLNNYLNEDRAYDHEIFLIKEIGRRDLKTGLLCNLTDGGDGVRNYMYTEKQRKATSKRTKGKNNPMYGKRRSVEERNKISKTRKKRIKSGRIKIYKHSENHKEKMKNIYTNLGALKTCKSVYKICYKTGIILDKYISSKEAARQNNITYNLKPEDESLKITGGWYWRYTTSTEIINGKLKNLENLHKKSMKFYSPIRNKRQIIKYSIQNKILKKYDTITNATKDSNLTYANLYKHLKENLIHEEHYWKYT